MLTGTIGALVAETQPPSRRMPIIVSCILYQGFGWTFSFALVVLWLIRLFEDGLPPPGQRPGMFIPICAPAYTIDALMGISRSLPCDYGYFASHSSAVQTLEAVALFVSLFLWLFAFWLFCIAFLSCVICIPTMPFTLTWWALVFPNVGFTIATISIGTVLESEAILWVTTGMTIVLFVVWLGTWAATVRAVWKGTIMWPGKDEDKELGGTIINVVRLEDVVAYSGTIQSFRFVLGTNHSSRSSGAPGRPYPIALRVGKSIRQRNTDSSTEPPGSPSDPQNDPSKRRQKYCS